MHEQFCRVDIPQSVRIGGAAHEHQVVDLVHQPPAVRLREESVLTLAGDLIEVTGQVHMVLDVPMSHFIPRHVLLSPRSHHLSAMVGFRVPSPPESAVSP
jgi:hypothetical protein